MMIFFNILHICHGETYLSSAEELAKYILFGHCDSIDELYYIEK